MVPASVRKARALLLALVLVSSEQGAFAQQMPDLVTPDALRVCADAADMPFTNRKGEGFENRIAEIVARDLNVPLRYYWMPHGPGFVRNTLGMRLCDLIIGYAAGTEIAQHSNPYYRSAFTMIVRRDGPLSGIEELSDQRLRGKRIGIIAATPPVDHLTDLGLMDQTKTYSLLVDRRYESPADEMIEDLVNKQIDAAILWGPTGGPLAKIHPELEVVPLIHEKERPPLAFRITMAMRPNELDWKRTINTVLRRRASEIQQVLLEYGVPLLDDEGHLINSPGASP